MFNLIKIGCRYLNNFASSFSIGPTYSCKRAKKRKMVATIFKIQGHFSEMLGNIEKKAPNTNKKAPNIDKESPNMNMKAPNIGKKTSKINKKQSINY